MQCRFCNHQLTIPLIDLVNSPASNSFLTAEQLNEPEVFYPLKVFICDNCFLVQIDEYKKSDAIFNNDYVYFSSYSTSWLAHCKQYTELMIERFGLNGNSSVVEVASNDGYLLQFFYAKKIPVLGIEPTANTAEVARGKGIPTITEFFGTKLAQRLRSEGKHADLLLGNNVLAHVPDIVDFVNGLKILLGETGVITLEFPHLLEMIRNNQFDTIYHEHFSYLSLHAVAQIFGRAGLEIFDVEKLPTHGGSLRIYGKHAGDNSKANTDRLTSLVEEEREWGVASASSYDKFQKQAFQIKVDLLKFLIDAKQANKSVFAYGAAAKGNTLLNYCGVKNDLINAVVDLNPYKQGKYLPGSHIPVVDENELKEFKPDYVLILPWNLKNEIVGQLSYINEWGGRFVLPVPALEII